MSPDSELDNLPLPRLLLNLLWELLKLGGPILGMAVVHPVYGVAVVGLAAALLALAARLRWSRTAKTLSWLLAVLVIGFSISFTVSIGQWWGVLLTLVVLVAGILLANALERFLGLAVVKPEPVESSASRGASAWGGGNLLTPEGEEVRTLHWSEIAMGGPTLGTYLFPDGVLLDGLGASARFSTSGRYFAAPLPSRSSWGLLILDRHEKRIYRHADIENFWELDSFTDEELIGRHSPLVGNSGYSMKLSDLLMQGEAIDLVPIHDLWVEPGCIRDDVPQTRRFPAPAGPHDISAIRHLPERLLALEDPIHPLRYPDYRLMVNQQLSDLLIDEAREGIWSEDGKAFACFARLVDATSRWSSEPWIWTEGEGWRQLPALWISADAEPGLTWSLLVRLDSQSLVVEGAMAFPYTNHIGFGDLLHETHSNCDIAIGSDPQGRLIVGEFQCSPLRLHLPLRGAGERGGSIIQSAPLANGLPARFLWQHDRIDTGQGAYRCEVGDWALPGYCLLDHRVSDCGRYLALVAFEDAPGVPNQVHVFDCERQLLLDFEGAPLVERLVDFRAGVLSLVTIKGRMGRDELGTPLRRFDRAAPAASRAAGFVRHQDESQLYYEMLELRVSDNALQEVPAWRQVDRPQVANAQGDFVLGSPTGNDAVWLFGAESKYRDSYLRERFPRQGGCAVTASGVAVADVGPSLIWSEDGHYLALTRFVDSMNMRERVETDQWQLILVDIRKHIVRDTRTHIGCMPLFERFGADGLDVRVFSQDWAVEDDAGELRQIPMAELLRLAEEPLIARGDLWLPASEQQRSGQWQRLGREHLRNWVTSETS